MVGLAAATTALAAGGTLTSPVQPQTETPVASNATNQSFDVSDVAVSTDGELEVSANISNPDDVPMIQDVQFRIDGELVESRPWALNPGETERITFTTSTENRSGQVVLSVLTRERGEVAVVEIPRRPSIAFEDQTTNGTGVTVANVSNPETPYYAAVWTINESTGGPETLLGATQVTTENASDVRVAFDEPINESQTLLAAVHPDVDGNASTIDPNTTDILASDTANVTVEAAPPTQAAVTFEEQSSDGTTVTVASATLPEGGFVVVHDTTLNESDALGSVRGSSSYLENGTSENVTVTLDEPINESQRLIAMAHMDTNGNRTNDFLATNGSEDGPYTVNGSAVIAAANVTVGEQPPVETSISFEDQTSDGTAAVVANVSNPETPYYAAVWTVNTSTGQPVELLGAAQLTGTSASNLNVPFTEASISESQTLLAAVHPDVDGNASTVDPDTATILDSDSANVTVETAPPAEASVTFEDQLSDGQNVTVASATLPEGGFVVVENETDVLGVTDYLDAGSYDNVTVRLFHVPGRDRIRDQDQNDDRLRNQTRLRGNQTLTALVNRDTNANESFDYVLTNGTEDGPYVDAEGAPVSDTANVTVEAGSGAPARIECPAEEAET